MGAPVGLDEGRLLVELIRDENERLKPYRCSQGKLTIGIGRNLDDVGITLEESRFLAKNDVERVCRELDAALPWWRKLDGTRQRALANMTFNLGLGRLLGFHNALAFMEMGRFDDAARAMLASLWAKQVGARADRLAELMRKGDLA